MRLNWRLVVATAGAVLLAGAGYAVTSGSEQAVIGIAMSNGAFRVDSSAMRGNASLFEGSTVETAGAPSHMSLRKGQKVELGTQSRARVYAQRVILERGVTQVGGPSGYEAVASGYRVGGEKEPALFRVAIGGGNRLQVTSVTGEALVRNRSGWLVARAMPGTTVDIAPQDTAAGATGPPHFTGCIQKTDGHYVLRDEASNSVIEVTGADMAANAGKTVEITATVDPAATPVTGATQLVHETSVMATAGKGCKVSIASAAAAGTAAKGAAGGGGSAGLSGAATAAIIAGVTVGGTLIGLAASGALSGSSSHPTP